jgi:adenine-specific DNA-methyltransferase
MNMSDKKQNGVVFTPDWVAEFMVDEIFKRVKLTGDEKILDAGCGEGMFSIKVVKKFAALTGKNIEKVIEDNLYFIDISKDYIKKTEDNLRKLTENKINKFNSIIDDFCFYDFKDKFDFIIGNPPYIRIQNLNDKREKLQKKYKTATNGSIDIYFCFFEKALKLLNENGKISFITPNSHFHSSAGLNLRLLLLPYINKIINFDHYQVFKDATAYTAISFIENKKSNFIEYTENFKDNFNYIKYKSAVKITAKARRVKLFSFLSKPGKFSI